MSVPSHQDKTREELIELWSFWQNETIKEQNKSRRLEEENNKLLEKYKLLRDNSMPYSMAKHMLKICSCLLSSSVFGCILIASKSPRSLIETSIYFIGSIISCLIAPFVLTFLCEITDSNFLNERLSKIAPYLIIPIIYLIIILNFG